MQDANTVIHRDSVGAIGAVGAVGTEAVVHSERPKHASCILQLAGPFQSR
jgi:hypothetical protein